MYKRQPTPRSDFSPVPTPAPLRPGSSGLIPSSLTPLPTSRSLILPSAELQESRLCYFPPLPPPAVCQDVLQSTSTSTSISTPRLPRPSFRLPTTQGNPGPSTFLKAARQESSHSLKDNDSSSAPRPVHSVSAYNRSGLNTCDLCSGSVARMTVRF